MTRHPAASRLWLLMTAIALLLSPSGHLHAQGDCSGRLIVTEDPGDARDPSIFIVTSRNTYLLQGSCFVLDKGEFSRSMSFFILSRGPEGFEAPAGVLLIRSIRTFAVDTQPQKIKVYRNKGWYVPGKPKQKMTTLAALGPPPRPVKTDPAAWYALHRRLDTPEAFGGKLGAPWHAYATEDRSISSTADSDQLWLLPDNRDFAKLVVTNYLIRFDINPDRTSSTPVRFSVDPLVGVDRIELGIRSNIGALASDLVFHLK